MSSIGGYKPGDQIGLGTVVRPADIKPDDVVKQVTVDIDLDGKVSPADDNILVKLPSKGVIPSNIAGFENKNQRTLSMAGSMTWGAVGGGVGGVLYVLGFAVITDGGVSIPNKAVGITIGIGAAIGTAVGAFRNYNNYQSKLEGARGNMVPDLVKPKMILNITE